MQERLTRGEGKVRGGRQTYPARHLVDLAGSACLSSMICTAAAEAIAIDREAANASRGREWLTKR